MSAYRISDDDTPRGRRDDLLRLVRQRLSQNARVVRLSGRIRRAVGLTEPTTPPAPAPRSGRD